MKLTYKYRIYPNKEQILKLEATLNLCKELYNTALEQRIKGYKAGIKVSYYAQANELLSLKEDGLYKDIHSQVLQSALKLLDRSYQNFFRRIKKGDKPGFPRFKSNDRFNSILYPQFNKVEVIDNKLYIPKLGDIKIKYHRPIQGNPKTLCIKRTNTDKWYITISCDNIPIKDRIKTILNKIGIDLGLEKFLVTSNDEQIDNPRHLKQGIDKIKNIQIGLSSKVRGSNNRKKIKSLLAIAYEKVTNQRNDFLHKTSRWLVDKYDLICHEDLKIKEMLQSKSIDKCKKFKSSLNRSITDVAWNKFIGMVTYKAEEAGKCTIPIDPRNTSKTCSFCNSIKEDLTLRDRIYTCDNCKISLDRDYNASCNILRLGTNLFSRSNSTEKTMCFSHR